MNRYRLVLLICAMAATGLPAAEPVPESGTFTGSWTVAGKPEYIDYGDGREAFVVRHKGDLLLSSRNGLPAAFRTDCLGYGIRDAQSQGRCVFTDTDGDHLYADLIVELTDDDRQPVSASIVGGSGKYSGITGRLRTDGWTYAQTDPMTGKTRAFMDNLEGSWEFAATPGATDSD